MTGLKSIFITLLITSAFQLIGQVVTPPDARGSYWIAPENYYAVNARGTAHTNIPAPKAAPGDLIPLVSIECIGATAIYRVVGEEGSTYSWTITDDTGAPLSWANLTGTNFTETITTNLGGTSTTVTNYGSETTVLWPFTGNYSLEVTQYSVHSCKTIKVGEVQVYPQPEIRNIEAEVATCPNVPYYFVTAEALNYGSLTWTTSGDGTFDNRNIAKATYTPGTNDITNGMVVLTIAAAGLGDSPGCQTATATTTLKIKSLEADVFTSTITCNGLADGGIRLENIKNGSGNYSLFIDGNRVAGGSGMIIYNGLSQGTHSVMLRDDITGCEQPLPNIFIPEPDLLTATVDADPPTCKGNDGKINISNPQNAASELVGVSGNYMYSIENTNGTYSKSSDKPYGPNDSYTFGGLATGTYTVKIWDADHSYCVQTLTPTITLSDPDPLFVAAAATDVTCFGANDGTVSVTVHTGGSGNYQYQLVEQSTGTPWAKGWVIETELLGTVSPGNYSLQMRDANNTGCVVTSPDLFTINEPVILAGTTTSTDERCWNAKDGTITILTSTGGHNKYEYMLSGTLLENGSTVSYTWTSDKTFANLAPGIYDMQMRDALFVNCTQPIGTTFTIKPALKLLATVTPVPVKCFGESNGEIVITDAKNGKAPYLFSIDGGSNWTSSTTITGLRAGTYTVTMIDGNTCSNTLDPVEITEPEKLVADYLLSVQTIAGKDVGTVTVTNQQGGTPYSGVNPYRFSKDKGESWQISPEFTDLNPGTYTITISDANNCEYDMFVNIRSIGLIAAKYNIQNVTCHDRNDGSIQFYDFTGAASGKYEVSINNGLTWEEVTGTTYSYGNLGYGFRDLVVREGKDKTTESYLIRKLIDQPPLLEASVILVQAETGTTKNGIIEVTVWSGGLGTPVFRINGSTWQSNPRFTGLAKGDYVVDIRDPNSALADCYISRPVKVVGEGELTASAVVIPARCYGDKATVTITAAGVKDIEYSIDGVNFYLNRPVFSVGEDGDYTLAIRDANNHANSIVIQGTEPFGKWKVTIPARLILTSIYERPTCQTPYAKVIVTGGTRNGIPVPVTGDLGEHRIQIGDIKTYYVYDQNGCPAGQPFGAPAPPSIASSVSVSPAQCYGGTGTVTFTAPVDGKAPYTYTVYSSLLTQSSTNKLVFGNLPSGITYTCTVTDATGCKYETSVAVGPAQPVTVHFAVTKGSLCSEGIIEGLISATGGTPPYYFEGKLMNGSVSKILDLSIGVLTLTVTDSNDCAGSIGVSPVAPPVLQVTSPVLACNDLFASLKIVQPYDPADPTRFQYSLDGGAWTSTTIFNGLAINTAHKLRAQDKTTQCISSEITVKTSDVSLPEMPVFYPLVIPTCLNPNGTITVKTPVNTGSRIYSYSIDGANYQTSPVFPNLVGTMTYTITVRDDISGCISSPVSIYVPAVPPPPVISVSGVSPKCYGEPYTITINAPPVVSAGKTYNFDGVYTFWYDGGKFDNVKIQGGVATITDIAQQPTNFNNIRFEANGCFSTGVNINVKIDVPEEIAIKAFVTENTLKGTQRGAIDLTVTGGSPKLSYAWISNTFTSTITTEDLNNMANGTYTVTITDANNCSITKMLKIPLNNPPVAVADKYLYLCTPLNENLLVNDIDPDPKEQNDSIIINTVAVISPKHFKTFQINADGTFNYEVQAGYSGTDVFVYEIADKFGQTATATVTIDIVSDFDGDGIPDLADADADGDGILNVDEVLAGQDWKTTDSDGDGHFNWLDIDSDNDGIVDNIEAQPTARYIAPSGIDSDGDGIDNAYDTDQGGKVIIPVDTDGDGIPDFLDADSDNDGVPDYIEGNDANSDGKPDLISLGKDTDADGLDDVYDIVLNGCNNGNSTGSNAPIQEFKGECNPDGIKDWRDDDDDNDDYLTRFEDMNADGDWSNDVTGHIGNPEYLWCGRDCELFIPDAFSPNNDNIHDYFQIYCIESYPNAHMYIFDQVGNKLYEKEHYGNLEFWKTADQAWWDGTTNNRSATRNGNKVVTGTYYYVLRLGNGDVKKSFVFVSY